MYLTHDFILLYFFGEEILCFIHIFQSKFLNYVFFNHIFFFLFISLFNYIFIWHCSIFLIKPIIFNISIDSFSLNTLSSLLPHNNKKNNRKNLCFIKNVFCCRVLKFCYLHCVKSVQIWSFFWSVFSCIRT